MVEKKDPKQSLLFIKPKAEQEQQSAQAEPPQQERQKPSKPEKPKPKKVVTSKTTPQTETQEQQPDKQQEQPDKPALFQALGIITGRIFFEEERGKIEMGGKEYPLHWAGSRRRPVYDALKADVEAGNMGQKLIVYPRVTHFPQRDKPHAIGFQLVGFFKDERTGAGEQLADFEFILSGLWQFIPVCQTPCISIFRNFTKERLNYIKECSSPEEKAIFMKAVHVPVQWRADIKPFRFNPRSEEQGKIHFAQIVARFNPERDVFTFVRQVAPIAEQSPRFLKISKDDKAAAAKAKAKKGREAKK